MVQTRIDHFYKVTSSNKKPENVKDNIKKSSNIKSPVIGKTVSYSCHLLLNEHSNDLSLLTV